MNAMERIKKKKKKKKQKELNEEDKKRIDLLEKILSDEGCFLKMPAETAFGILEFLETPDEEAKELYFGLISPEIYKKVTPNQRITIVK